MNEYFGNPIFNQKRDVTKEEKEEIDRLVENFTLSLFSAVNKRFNSLGLCLQIMKLPDEGAIQ